VPLQLVKAGNIWPLLVSRSFAAISCSLFIGVMDMQKSLNVTLEASSKLFVMFQLSSR
jgi:hypothetical protein